MNSLLTDTKLAIELEEKGYDYYSKTAAKTSNPLAASTLDSLAARELVHLERVKEFYLNLTGKKTFEKDWLKKVEVPPTKAELLTPILKKLKENLIKKFEREEDITEAYKIAEELERDSFTLYDKISKENPDETTIKFYSSLAQEEREHYDILDETLEYLNDPGEWYRLKERWIVEG